LSARGTTVPSRRQLDASSAAYTMLLEANPMRTRVAPFVDGPLHTCAPPPVVDMDALEAAQSQAVQAEVAARSRMEEARARLDAARREVESAERSERDARHATARAGKALEEARAARRRLL
jgi:hypothetical protein